MFLQITQRLFVGMRQEHRDLLKSLTPRIEDILLIAGLIFTICGKLSAVWSYKSQSLIVDTVVVTFPDFLFFASVALLIRFLYILKPSAICARCSFLIATLVVIWSVMNSCWLLFSGVQLQPSILLPFVRDFRDIWPLVKAHLKGIIPLGLGGIGVFVIFIWCFLRPGKIITRRSYHAQFAAVLASVIVLVLLAEQSVRACTNSSFAEEVLDFNSHWYALVSVVEDRFGDDYAKENSSYIYQKGQRQIGIPECPVNKLPNVVLVMLESISHSATSLSSTSGQTTPFLARLAHEGIEFRTTRVTMPYTNKAFWATLTATTPTNDIDALESIPVDKPYEALPSILADAGYRCAFFEMSRGDFACGPGFFSNLGFHWAWFRENLEDPSAYIGYLSGDDYRMIKPAVEWVKDNEKPFFLMMITSVGHDPFIVPDWFEKPKRKLNDKYIQTVRYTDYFLEQLCNELRANGLDDNTIICVLGDHGTSFRAEHVGRWIPYEEVIRIPWVIYWPGHIAPGQVVEQPCSQMDVTPTILSLLGFDITNADFEGTNALAKIDSQRRCYFSCLLSGSPLGFIEGNRKVIYWPYIDKAFEYNLEIDPKEQHPATIFADRMEQIKEDLFRWERKSRLAVDIKKHTKQLLFTHWQIFSDGSYAWAHYVHSKAAMF
jgi:glucan phosphoethanolaminetransferase (alkaline phosphatase superfamily)